MVIFTKCLSVSVASEFLTSGLDSSDVFAGSDTTKVMLCHLNVIEGGSHYQIILLLVMLILIT